MRAHSERPLTQHTHVKHGGATVRKALPVLLIQRARYHWRDHTHVTIREKRYGCLVDFYKAEVGQPSFCQQRLKGSECGKTGSALLYSPVGCTCQCATRMCTGLVFISINSMVGVDAHDSAKRAKWLLFFCFCFLFSPTLVVSMVCGHIN
jgi:hypothetical protein